MVWHCFCRIFFILLQKGSKLRLLSARRCHFPSACTNFNQTLCAEFYQICRTFQFWLLSDCKSGHMAWRRTVTDTLYWRRTVTDTLHRRGTVTDTLHWRRTLTDTLQWRRTITDKVSFFSLSEVRSCRAVWTVTLLHLLQCLWLQHTFRVLLTINLQAFVAVGVLFLLLIFMSSWNLIGILHWIWVTYCSVFMGHIVVKWDGGCYLIPSSPDVCPSPLGSSQAVLPFVRLNCLACNVLFMLSVKHWWQRGCRRITAAEYCCVLTMKTRSLPKSREPRTASLPRRPNSWKPLLWKPQAVMMASEVWVWGLWCEHAKASGRPPEGYQRIREYSFHIRGFL